MFGKTSPNNNDRFRLGHVEQPNTADPIILSGGCKVMAKRVYIAHEAAAVSGAPVALYQKEISGRRMPHEEGVNKLRSSIGPVPWPLRWRRCCQRYCTCRRSSRTDCSRIAAAGDGVPDELVIGHTVGIDTGPALRAVRRRAGSL